MNVRPVWSLLASLGCIVVTIGLTGCAERSVRQSPRTPASSSGGTLVQMHVCSLDKYNNCVNITLPGTTDPLELDDTPISPRMIFVDRTSPTPKDNFIIKMARFTTQSSVPATIKLDTGDLTPANVDLASAVVDSGWAAMIRSTGIPPLRTIRITTGRPALDSGRQASAETAPESVAPTAAQECAVLVVIEPGATQNRGVEYYFLATTNQTTHTLALWVGESSKKYRVDLPDGHFLRVDRAKPGQISSPVPFPTQQTVSKLEPWVQEAIKGGSMNGYMFVK